MEGDARVRAIAPLYSVEFSPWIRRLSLVLLSLFILGPLVAMFAPWQQNVTGAGRVAAFTPLDRPQVVQAPVRGRVVEVFVNEADAVLKGDPLVRIVDIDPQIGLSKKDLGRAQVMLDSPGGLVLCCGPTGSGKTATLYAALELP